MPYVLNSIRMNDIMAGIFLILLLIYNDQQCVHCV